MKALSDYIEEILRKSHTNEEWKLINQEIDSLYKDSSQKEILEFEKSGAADTLGMILEYID